jgi:MHS family proline/betaine transporter-like MFS transporter
LTANAQAIHPGRSEMRRAIGAAVIGNALEFYDFVVYSYLATVIAKNFFPADNEVAALLATFGTFGVGFIVRPLGALVIGWIGDRHGRRAALVLTIMLMAVGTVLIGLIPAYATVGALAPAILVFARLVQGFSVGGEWGSSTAFIAEWAPEHRRGYYSSWQQFSVVAGLLAGSGIAAVLSTVLSPEAMESWGWRVPFLLGGLIGPVGAYMRRQIDESPAYRRTAAAQSPANPAASPVMQTLQAFGFMIVSAVQFYIFLAYMPTFTQSYAGLGRAEALWSNTAGLLLLMIATPLFGALSDRVGRKPLMIASCLFFAVATYPIFSIMQNGASLAMVVAIQLLVGLAIALYCGALPSAIAEIFETRTRSTLLSIANGTAVAIFGGFAPFIATWLIARTGSPVSPTYYVIGAAAISLVAVLSVAETAHRKLA